MFPDYHAPQGCSQLLQGPLADFLVICAFGTSHSFWLHFSVWFIPHPHAPQYAPHRFSPPTNASLTAALLVGCHCIVMSVSDDHFVAHIVFNRALSPGTRYLRHLFMGPDGASQGPPALPAEVPSLVCQASPSGLSAGAPLSRNSIQWWSSSLMLCEQPATRAGMPTARAAAASTTAVPVQLPPPRSMTCGEKERERGGEGGIIVGCRRVGGGWEAAVHMFMCERDGEKEYETDT